MRHLVLVGPPRSGAALLASVLGTAPGWGSSALTSAHLLDDAGMSAADRGYVSHRLTVADATPTAVDAIRRAATTTGDAPLDVTVDWNPRLSLALGLVARALPDADLLLMSRRPVPTISSLMEAWGTGRFATVRDLPGWWGEPWAFPLVDGWRDLIGAPPARVCTAQWAAITRAVLDDLADWPSQQWTVASYEALLADPAAEVAAVTGALGLPWPGRIPEPLPMTASAVRPPGPGTWVHNWSEIAAALPTVQPVVDRLREVSEQRRPGIAWPELEPPPRVLPTVATRASAGTPFSSSHTRSVADLLQQAGVSLVLSTYKSGHVIVARVDGTRLDTEFTTLNRPMGIAVAGTRLAIGAADAILSFSDNPGLAGKVASHRRPDTVYAPRAVVFTGDVAIHDMGYGGDGTLYFVNTLFSCVCRQDVDYSFVPVWRPSWITGLAAEDRCHLNGIAIVDGRPRFATALARTDAPNGWRELRGTSGVLVDMASDEVVADGLSMPHSPRWHDGRLWLLESGKGTVATVDPGSGDVTTVATLPGFTRGLSFVGPYAVVGLSQVRESVFSELPITQDSAERNCGVWVVDTRTGETVGFLRFDGVVQELFDVQVLPATWPVLVDAGDLTLRAYVLPESALRDVVRP